jgi:mRNA interferase MazF
MVMRGEVWLVALDPVVGSEIQKTRPCMVVSPPELHDHLRTVIVAPMTTAGRPAPYRVPVTFARRKGLILMDQLRTVDQARLISLAGVVAETTLARSLKILREVFTE